MQACNRRAEARRGRVCACRPPARLTLPAKARPSIVAATSTTAPSTPSPNAQHTRTCYMPLTQMHQHHYWSIVTLLSRFIHTTENSQYLDFHFETLILLQNLITVNSTYVHMMGGGVSIKFSQNLLQNYTLGINDFIFK